MRFKALRGSPKRKVQIRQYLLAVDLDRYKWYQSQTPDDVRAFSLFSKGVDMRQCASKDVGPKGGGFGGGTTSVGGRKECQRGCWPRKGGL